MSRKTLEHMGRPLLAAGLLLALAGCGQQKQDKAISQEPVRQKERDQDHGLWRWPRGNFASWGSSEHENPGCFL